MLSFSTLLLAAFSAASSGCSFYSQHHEFPSITTEAFSSRTYFYIGGRYVDTALPGSNSSAQYMTGQIYVERLLPRIVTKQYPVLFITGNGQTSTNFLNTPDGREGWASYFLRQGYTVYLTDQAQRGRSSYLPGDGGLMAFSTTQYEQLWTAPEQQVPLPYPQAALHNQFPGKGVVGDPIFNGFYASQVLSQSNGTLQALYNNASYAALLNRFGPSFVIMHSQSWPWGFQLGDARPELVKGLISMEPQGPTFENWEGPPFRSGYSTTGGKRPYGLTPLPLHYDPPIGSDPTLLQTQVISARDSNSSDCTLQTEPAKQLVNLAKVPVLFLVGEASYHDVYDYCTVSYLRQAGVMVDFAPLGSVGIHGNGHFMFLEKNNRDIIEQVVLPWVEKLGGSNSTC